MTYAEAEAFLFEQLPMFQRIGGAAYKNDLQNTYALMEALGNPHREGKFIHVAGTNGKGSTSAMLASVLKEAGYKTALYTSPHLKSFTERMRINGEAIAEQEVIQYVAKFKPLIESLKPSFFELTTAMAFDYFARKRVDVAVIEVGMGGRLDCTNVIQPELSIVTQIGLDHQQFLGDTLEKITTEKAGIIKNNTPVITSIKEIELRLIVKEKADSLQAPYIYSEDAYHVQIVSKADDYWKYSVEEVETGDHMVVHSGLTGDYQTQNLQTTFAAIAALQRLSYQINTDHILRGLKNVMVNTGIRGRWQFLKTAKDSCRMVADTGHNVNAFEYIVAMLQNESYGKLHMVIGTVNDKSIEAVLDILPRNASYYFTQANIPRALSVSELQIKANKSGLIGSTYEHVGLAIEAAQLAAGKSDLIFIGGSTFVVAEIPNQYL